MHVNMKQQCVSELPHPSRILRVLSKGSIVSNFMESPLFWPIAVKGGFENTLRDVMVAELQDMRYRNLVFTGERARHDICAYKPHALTAQGSSQNGFGAPEISVELKFNFMSQKSEQLRAVMAMNRPVPLPAASTFAIHFFLGFTALDDVSKALLRRYVPLKDMTAVSLSRKFVTQSFQDCVNECRGSCKGHGLLVDALQRRWDITDGTCHNHGIMRALIVRPDPNHRPSGAHARLALTPGRA